MQEQEKQTAKGRDLYEWVQSLVGSVLVVVAIFTFVIRMMGVDGHSMLNTLQHGDRLLVVNSMLYHDYKYGDIVILRKNGVFDDDPHRQAGDRRGGSDGGHRLCRGHRICGR